MNSQYLVNNHIQECINEAMPIIRNWLTQPRADIIGLLAFIAKRGNATEREEARTIKLDIERHYKAANALSAIRV